VYNLTRHRLASQINGYRHLLHADFMADDAGEAQQWERFWLSPAHVTRLQSARSPLTLFDVPLKVATQVMMMQHGKLTSAPDAVRSSPGAQAFAQWFTDHYDAIEAEWRSTPPPGSGIEGDVNVFFELRRIALIAAIAEKLRDDGAPLPAWMHEYPVTPITVDPTTPALRVEDVQQTTRREGDTQILTTTTRRLYGGVKLSPADTDVHYVPQSPVAAAVAQPMQKAIQHGELLQQVAFRAADTTYMAAILPGAASRDIGGLSLEAVDVWVPIAHGGGIALTRTYHSFYTPASEFGAGWTLDLPRLEARRRPTQRTGDMTTFTTGYELTSPLHTWSALFTHEAMVPELGGTFFVPQERGDVLAVARLQDKPGPTVFMHNGQQLHFDAHGALLAIETAPTQMVYQRDASGRCFRLEHWHGGERLADITLAYDADGRVTSARGSNGATASYIYDAAGRLQHVHTDAGVTEYTSQDGLIIAIRQDGQDVARFQYNDRGQLQREWRAAGESTTYTRQAAHDGTTLVIQRRNQDTCREGDTPSKCVARDVVTTIEYDAHLRPRLHVLADGSRVAWSATADGARQVTYSRPDGSQVSKRVSADGKDVSITLPEGGQLHIAKDGAGRLTALEKAGQPLLRQVWRRDGQLGRRVYVGTIVQPEYGEGGVMTGLLVAAPTAGTHVNQWTHTTYDALGRPTEITDVSGMNVQIAWYQAPNGDDPPALARIVTNRGQMSITHDDDGRVTEIATSWGTRERREYIGPDGALSRVHLQHDHVQAAVDLNRGRVTKIQPFDGGAYAFDYHTQHAGQVARISVPGNVELRYDYDANDRLSAVSVGGVYRITYTYDDHNRIARITRVPIAK
jgi:YD repeat-containing protein